MKIIRTLLSISMLILSIISFSKIVFINTDFNENFYLTDYIGYNYFVFLRIAFVVLSGCLIISYLIELCINLLKKEKNK